MMPGTSKIWGLEGMEGLTFLTTDYNDRGYPGHFHEEYVLAYTERGGACFRGENRTGETRVRQMILFNPGETHAAWMGKSEGWAHRSVYLSENAMVRISEGLEFHHGGMFDTNTMSQHDIADRFYALHRVSEIGQEKMRGEEMLFEAFHDLLKHHQFRPQSQKINARDKQLFDRVVDYMHANYDMDVSLQDLADVAIVTPYRLISLFKRISGLTPYAYLIQVRFNRACMFLREGGRPADAANTAGFYDQSLMTNYFRKFLGVTPLQYRNAVYAA